MEDTDFYATVKLKNSEEIFSLVSPSDEGDKTFLMLSNPVVIEEVVIRGKHVYKVDPWLKTSTSDLIVLDMENVLTIVECLDFDIIKLYHQYLRKLSSTFKKETNDLNRKMGYISNINDARILLENIFKS